MSTAVLTAAVVARRRPPNAPGQAPSHCLRLAREPRARTTTPSASSASSEGSTSLSPPASAACAQPSTSRAALAALPSLPPAPLSSRLLLCCCSSLSSCTSRPLLAAAPAAASLLPPPHPSPPSHRCQRLRHRCSRSLPLSLASTSTLPSSSFALTLLAPVRCWQLLSPPFVSTWPLLPIFFFPLGPASFPYYCLFISFFFFLLSSAAAPIFFSSLPTSSSFSPFHASLLPPPCLSLPHMQAHLLLHALTYLLPANNFVSLTFSTRLF